MDKQDLLTLLAEIVVVVSFISITVTGRSLKKNSATSSLVVKEFVQGQLQEPAIEVESLLPITYESDITEFCYLNPAELADRFGLTVNTILKHINDESRYGYTFEAWSMDYERYFAWKYCYLDRYNLAFYPARADLFTEYLLNYESKKEQCLKRFWNSLEKNLA